MRPVHEAAARNDMEELRRLLDEDPSLLDLAIPDTPLYCAAFRGSVDAARLLLDRGADVDWGREWGKTALRGACTAGRVEVLALLLSRGVDLSPLVPWGLTPFMAAMHGEEEEGADHVAVIQLLIQAGVPVDARDSTGCTALWYACYHGHTERARVLLVEGLADHTIADYQGKTPMAAARRQWHEGCIRLLQVGREGWTVVQGWFLRTAVVEGPATTAAHAAAGAWQWYEGELHKPFLLSKARAVLDATHSITKAPEKVGAQTQAETQRAREDAAPAWLRGRVVKGEALPVVGVMTVVWLAEQHVGGEEEEERDAVCRWLASVVSEDLHLEMMEGLRRPGWAPGEDDGDVYGDMDDDMGDDIDDDDDEEDGDANEEDDVEEEKEDDEDDEEEEEEGIDRVLGYLGGRGWERGKGGG